MKIKLIKDIRKKLKSKDVSIGTWQQIPNSSISEILGDAKYDWVAVDMEHGSITVDQLPDLFRAIELGGALPMARIPLPSSKECKSALDAGAGGIIVPMIETAKQLEQIRDACCWPPNGNRGVGFSRANLFGKKFEQYKEEAKTPLLIAQIENKSAIKNLDEIVKINGLDAIIIGPYDLSASMGITAEFDNEKFKDVMSSIKKICQKNNIAFGDHIVKPDPELLLNRIKNGYTFIAYGTDGVFLNTSSKNPLD